MRKVYIDLGANNGETIKHWLSVFDKQREFDIYAFEPNPCFEKDLKALNVNVHMEAAWINNGTMELFLDESKNADGSSFDKFKTSGQMSKEPIMVPCIDFSEWLRDNFILEDYVVLKMNIEGAEYPILEDLFVDDTIVLVDKLFVWWHYISYHYSSLTEGQKTTHGRILQQVYSRGILATPEEERLLAFGNTVQ